MWMCIREYGGAGSVLAEDVQYLLHIAPFLASGEQFSVGVGSCPTFGERKPHAETYILDFSDAIYGEEIRVYLLEFLRDEKQFNSADDLIMQIKLDINYTIKKNGEQTWQELGLK